MRIYTGGATGSIVSAYAGLPTLYYSDQEVVAHNLRQDMLDGEWFVPKLDGAAYVSDRNMAEQLGWLLGNPTAIQSVQRRNFTPPATWDTGLELAEAIISG